MKMQTAGAGGPTQERELPQTVDQLDEEYCKESISLMNHTTDREIVMQKMKETFNYRQRLIHNSDESHTILTVFPRLLDNKGLVSNGIFFFSTTILICKLNIWLTEIWIK